MPRRTTIDNALTASEAPKGTVYIDYVLRLAYQLSPPKPSCMRLVEVMRSVETRIRRDWASGMGRCGDGERDKETL